MSFLTPRQKMELALSDAELNTWHTTANGIEVYGSRNVSDTENMLLAGIEMIAHDRDGKWYKLSYDFELGGIVATPK